MDYWTACIFRTGSLIYIMCDSVAKTTNIIVDKARAARLFSPSVLTHLNHGALLDTMATSFVFIRNEQGDRLKQLDARLTDTLPHDYKNINPESN